MTTTWQPVAAIPATENTPHLCAYGVVHPQVEVALAGEAGETPHIAMATVGPEGDEPDARLTAADARALAAALLAAAEAVEAGQ